jgi:hypothetical protein
MSYYAIEAGREGDTPRILHRFAGPSSTRTRCGRVTTHCVSVLAEREGDTLCARCSAPPDSSAHDDDTTPSGAREGR